MAVIGQADELVLARGSGRSARWSERMTASTIGYAVNANITMSAAATRIAARRRSPSRALGQVPAPRLK